MPIIFSFLILTTGHIEDSQELQNQLFNHMKSGKYPNKYLYIYIYFKIIIQYLLQ